MTVKIGNTVTVLIKPHPTAPGSVVADLGACAAVVTRVWSNTTAVVKDANGSPRSISVATVNYRLISDDDDEHGRKVTSAAVYASSDDAKLVIAERVRVLVASAIAAGQTLDTIIDPRASGTIAYLG